jgi:hypothetical protein
VKFPSLPKPVTHDFGPDLAWSLEQYLLSRLSDLSIFDDPLSVFDSQTDLKEVVKNLASRLTGEVTARQFVQAWALLNPYIPQMMDWYEMDLFLRHVNAPKEFVKRAGLHEPIIGSNAYMDRALGHLPQSGSEWLRTMLYPRFGNEISWVSISIYSILALALLGAALTTALDRPTVENFIFGAGKVVALMLLFAITIDLVLFLLGSFVSLAIGIVSALYGGLSPYLGKPVSVIVMGILLTSVPFIMQSYAMIMVVLIGLTILCGIFATYSLLKKNRKSPDATAA